MGVIFIVMIVGIVGLMVGYLIGTRERKPSPTSKSTALTEDYKFPAGSLILIRGTYNETKALAKTYFNNKFISEAGNFGGAIRVYMPDEFNVEGKVSANVYYYWSSYFIEIDIPDLLEKLSKQLHMRHHAGKSLILAFDDNMPAEVFKEISTYATIILTQSMEGDKLFYIEKCPESLKDMFINGVLAIDTTYEIKTKGVSNGSS